MLEKLTIKNVALIDNAEIEFFNGINVLSGETGAGKSVILDSLNFVLGAKADKSLIRSGENESFVKAEFNVLDNAFIKNLFCEFDLDEEDVLIVSRKLSLDGKSKITVNGQTATVSMVKKFTSALLDVHGQSEHFSLLKNSNQLDLIDKFGGNCVFELKEQIKNKFSEYNKVLSGLKDLGGNEDERLIRLDVLNYQINEISSANITENEEEELSEISYKLRNLEKISSSLGVLCGSFNDEGGVCDLVSNSLKALSLVANFSGEYQELYDRLYSLSAELDDIGETANSFLDGLDNDSYNPDEVEARLETIKNLKRKYGGTVQAVFEFLDNAQKEKNRLENFNELSKELLKEKSGLENDIYSLYVALSDKRQKAAKDFSTNVINELKQLGMENANFSVDFSFPSDKKECKFISTNGFDTIEFKFSANLGEPLKPLSEIISGGEISRFMLAIKAQTAKYNDISTFVFDEIDAGISGKAAKVVAQKFAKISKDTQIIAITHLPQISAMADNNLFIEKVVENGKTVTKVNVLDKTAKVKEIVRLTGGNAESDSAIKLAKELIEEADLYKKSI